MKKRSKKVKLKKNIKDCNFLHDYHCDILEYHTLNKFYHRGHLGSPQVKEILKNTILCCIINI